MKGEEDAARVRARAACKNLFILHKTLLTHCLRNVNLEIPELLIRVFLRLPDFFFTKSCGLADHFLPDTWMFIVIF